MVVVLVGVAWWWWLEGGTGGGWWWRWWWWWWGRVLEEVVPPGGGLWWWGVEVSLLTSDAGAPDPERPAMSSVDFYIMSMSSTDSIFSFCHNFNIEY